MPDRPQTIREAEKWLASLVGLLHETWAQQKEDFARAEAAESTVRALREQIEALEIHTLRPEPNRVWCVVDAEALRALLLASPQSQEGKR